MASAVKKPERELFVTEIISQTFTLYSTRLVPFYIIFLMATLINTAVGEAIRFYFNIPPIPSTPASTEEILNWVNTYLGPFLLMTFLIVVISLVIVFVANGLAVKYASDVLEKGDASLERGLSFAASKLPSLFVAGIISAVLIAIGLAFLAIPGIIITIMFSLLVQVIIIEDVGAFDSFGRSRKLVSGRWLKTFGLFLVLGIIILVISLIGYAIGLLFGPASWVVSSLVSAFVQPILPIALTLYYYSMVAKEAAFMKTWPSPPPPPPPPSASPPPPAPAEGIKFCPHCGGQISPETVFCPYCGKKIEITS